MLLGDAEHRILELDVRIEAITPVGDDGLITLYPPETPLELAWPLPPITRYYERVGARFVARDPAELGPWLAGLRVARPPCGEAPVARPIDALSGDGGVGFVVAWGDGVLIGLNRSGRTPARVVRIDEALAVSTLPPFTRGSTEARSSPTAFVDGETLYVAWVDPESARVELVGIDRSHQVVERFFPTNELVPEGRFEALAAGRFDGRRTLVGRLAQHTRDTEPQPTYFVVLDEERRAWREVFRMPESAWTTCKGFVTSLILEVDGPGRGRMGVKHGPIQRFDVAVPGGLLPGALFVPDERQCRNARATLDDGVELLTFASNERGPDLLWRPRDGEWRSIKQRTPVDARILIAVGNRAVTALEGKTVAIYEHDPARPELPPRLCHVLPLSFDAEAGARHGDRRVILGSDDGTPALALDFPPEPRP